jgi:hypothetical protein
MVGVLEAFYVLQFVVAIIMIIVKLYNVMSNGTIYDFRISILGLITYALCFAVGFVVVMNDPTTLIYSTLFYIESWCLVLIIMLFIVEVLFVVRDKSTKSVESYKSNQVGK